MKQTIRRAGAGAVAFVILSVCFTALFGPGAAAEPETVGMTETLDQEYWDDYETLYGIVNGGGLIYNNYVAQTFTPTMPILSSVDLFLWPHADSKDYACGVNVTIYEAKPNRYPDLSNPLTEVRTDADYFSVPGWYKFDFPDIRVNSGEMYFIRVDANRGFTWKSSLPHPHHGWTPYPDGSSWSFLMYDDYGYESPEKSYFFRTYAMVVGNMPVANAGPDRIVLVNDPIHFSGAASYDPDGPLESYSWDLGDGTTREGMEFTHAYNSSGSYLVTLTVTDSDGLTDTDSCTVTVEMPPPNQAPIPVIEASGFLGRYFNLPDDHPDVEGNITGIVTGDSPFNHDWYDEEYYSFTRLDPDLAFGNDFFPVDEGLPGDPLYFSVHWQATLRVPVSGVYSFEIGSDDDSWVYVDNQMVCDLGGIHALSITTHTAYLSAGGHRLDIYFAERRSVQSGFHFRFLDDNVTASVVLSDCPGTVRVVPDRTLELSATGSYDPDSEIVNFTWDFGDGTLAYGETVSHAYPGEGMHHITLAVRDDEGAVSRKSVSVEVISDPELSGEPEPATLTDAGESAPEEKVDAGVQLIEASEAVPEKKDRGASPFTIAFASLAMMAVALGRSGKTVRPRGRRRKIGWSLKEK